MIKLKLGKSIKKHLHALKLILHTFHVNKHINDILKS